MSSWYLVKMGDSKINFYLMARTEGKSGERRSLFWYERFIFLIAKKLGLIK